MAVTAGFVALSACLTPVRPSRPGEDVARYVLPPGNYGGLPTTDRVARSAAAVRRPDPAARQRLLRRHPEPLPARGLPAGRRDAGDRHRSPGAAAGLRRVRRATHLRTDARRRRIRGGLGHGARPHAALAARPRARARGRRRRSRHRRVLARDERPVVRAERGDRSARDAADRPDREDLRRQGTPNHRRRPSRSGRCQRVRTRRTTSTWHR